jgi:hypothetical protein
MTFVRVDEEGVPIPISEQVKRKFKEEIDLLKEPI